MKQEKFLQVSKLNYEVGDKKILNDINFSLKKGQILSLVGPSGSGKTTILKAIAGLIQPTQGNISLLNSIISSEKILVPTGKRRIGLMFQEDVLFPHYTVYKNIEFGLHNKEKKAKENIISK